MGVLFSTTLDFRPFFDEIRTVYRAVGIPWTLFDPKRPLKMTRDDVKYIENSIF